MEGIEKVLTTTGFLEQHSPIYFLNFSAILSEIYLFHFSKYKPLEEFVIATNSEIIKGQSKSTIMLSLNLLTLKFQVPVSCTDASKCTT